MIKRALYTRAEGSKRAHLLSSFPSFPPPPPPPPPPPHIHQRDSYIPFLFIVFAPLPIQHSFLCSFKWMSLLKTVPQPKKILCSLFTYMVFIPLKIKHLFCSLISKKIVSFSPKLLGGNMSKENKCDCNINIFKGVSWKKNENYQFMQKYDFFFNTIKMKFT